MTELGKGMVMMGAALVVIGAILWGLSRVPGFSRLGSLPGDVRIQNGNLQIFAPFTTMILVSAILSLLLLGVQLLRRS